MTGQSGGNTSGWVAGLFLFQAPWLALAIFVWQLPFFFSSMLYDNAWWGMLFILILYAALLPTLIALGIKMTNVPNVSNRYKEQIWIGISLLPVGLEFAYLWMVALPFTWTLLPWGDFAYNWWKIFPYFGLSWMSIFSLFPLYMIFGPDPEPVHELGSRYLQKGMKGSDVREVQQLLNEHGISCGVDGNFGPQTEDAVKQFQTGVGFGMKDDGVVGKKTLAALRIVPEKPEISVSVNPPVPIHHQPITVSFSGNTGDNGSWIGLYLPDASNVEHGESWLYVGGAKTPSEAVDEGAVTFSEGLAPGDYEVRLFGDNGYGRILVSQAFTVSETEPEPEPGPELESEPEPEPEPAQTEEPIPAKVEEPKSPPSNDLKAVAKDLQTAAFSSDRKKIIEGLGDTPQSLDITIERVDRTTGIGLPDELRRGMTIYGKNTDGSELEIRMPNSMNDELKKLGKGDSLSCDAVAVSWNSMRKLIQMNWKG